MQASAEQSYGAVEVGQLVLGAFSGCRYSLFAFAALQAKELKHALHPGRGNSVAA